MKLYSLIDWAILAEILIGQEVNWSMCKLFPLHSISNRMSRRIVNGTRYRTLPYGRHKSTILATWGKIEWYTFSFIGNWYCKLLVLNNDLHEFNFWNSFWKCFGVQMCCFLSILILVQLTLTTINRCWKTNFPYFVVRERLQKAVVAKNKLKQNPKHCSCFDIVRSRFSLYQGCDSIWFIILFH